MLKLIRELVGDQPRVGDGPRIPGMPRTRLAVIGEPIGVGHAAKSPRSKLLR
ncbi:MAG: hypothetical protein HYW08_11470 [candidate division NC10 bacterium]|nr:hypothetical protein [candidate division NC10 bacterium]